MENIEHVINESIKYELDVYKLYTLFSETFVDDSEFWETLANEERNHASILRKSKSFFHKDNKMMNVISVEDINTIKECRNIIKFHTDEFRKNPTQNIAYKIAIKLENSKVEKNYQKFMNKLPDNELAKVFHMLNGEEMDHLKRIQEYFDK